MGLLSRALTSHHVDPLLPARGGGGAAARPWQDVRRQACHLLDFLLLPLGSPYRLTRPRCPFLSSLTPTLPSPFSFPSSLPRWWRTPCSSSGSGALPASASSRGSRSMRRSSVAPVQASSPFLCRQSCQT